MSQTPTMPTYGDVYAETTLGITVEVSPTFLEDQSQPENNHYVWAYTIAVINDGDDTVQLTERAWEITDANGSVERVSGPGVVGEQPILNPGDSFSYTSGCPLKTSSGFMAGYYTMRRVDGSEFAVKVPTFSLDLPGARIRVN